MITVNLLPRNNRLMIFYSKVQLLVFLLLAGIILFSWHLVLQQKIVATVKASHQLQQEVVKESNFQLEQQHQVTQQDSSDLARIKDNRINLVKFFAALHAGITDSLYLTQLSLVDGGIKIIGSAGSITEIVALVTKLSGSGGKMLLVQKIVRTEGGYNFVIG